MHFDSFSLFEREVGGWSRLYYNICALQTKRLKNLSSQPLRTMLPWTVY